MKILFENSKNSTHKKKRYIHIYTKIPILFPHHQLSIITTLHNNMNIMHHLPA